MMKTKSYKLMIVGAFSIMLIMLLGVFIYLLFGKPTVIRISEIITKRYQSLRISEEQLQAIAERVNQKLPTSQSQLSHLESISNGVEKRFELKRIPWEWIPELKSFENRKYLDTRGGLGVSLEDGKVSSIGMFWDVICLELECSPERLNHIRNGYLFYSYQFDRNIIYVIVR